MSTLLETIKTLQTELDTLGIIEKKSAEVSAVCSIVNDLELAHLDFYDCHLAIECSATNKNNEERDIQLLTEFLSEDENQRIEKSLFFRLSTFNAELLVAQNIQVKSATLFCVIEGYVELNTKKTVNQKRVHKQFSISASSLAELSSKAHGLDVFEMFFSVLEDVNQQSKKITIDQLRTCFNKHEITTKHAKINDLFNT